MSESRDKSLSFEDLEKAFDVALTGDARPTFGVMSLGACRYLIRQFLRDRVRPEVLQFIDSDLPDNTVVEIGADFIKQYDEER